MTRMAIVSSYNESCGNASYTHVLRHAFGRQVEVEVIPLDLFLLTKSGRMFVRCGDEHIKQIAEKLKGFDYVNIQFEAGLYGGRKKDILRRVKWLLDAAPNVVLTMHRIDPLDFTWKKALVGYWAELPNVARATKRVSLELALHGYATLYHEIISHCDRLRAKKNAWICVHTKRERRLVRDIYKAPNCFDYPLTFLNAEERRRALAHADNSALLKTCGVPPGSKVVGVFGYIASYKGIETVIQAIARLPKDYYLCFIGSQHPQSIREYTAIDAYLGSVIDFIRTTQKEVLKEKLERFKFARAADPRMRIALPTNFGAPPADDAVIKDLLDDELFERIRFVGNLPDPEFIEALRLCDAVVLPYLEVGQSMSGVIALATEAGARLFCSNNLSFAEVKKYYGDVFHNFDIGNYLELAQKIRNGGDDFRDERDALFERYNIEENVRMHLAKFGFTPAPAPAEARQFVKAIEAVVEDEPTGLPAVA